MPPALELSAVELIEKIRESGGRVYRMREEPFVFVLTGNRKLAMRLLDLGGKVWTHMAHAEEGYLRARPDVREWDIYIHQIPVTGEQTMWEAAK